MIFIILHLLSYEENSHFSIKQNIVKEKKTFIHGNLDHNAEKQKQKKQTERKIENFCSLLTSHRHQSNWCCWSILCILGHWKIPIGNFISITNIATTTNKKTKIPLFELKL